MAEPRCEWPPGCEVQAACDLSINAATWRLCDDHAARLLEAIEKAITPATDDDEADPTALLR